jgi:hypothetical protein
LIAFVRLTRTPSCKRKPSAAPDEQTASLRRALLVTSRLARGADRIDPIVLRAIDPLERTDLDDLLAGIDEEHDQAGGEAAGPFLRPDPPAASMLAGPGEHSAIAGTIGGLGQASLDPPGTGIERGQVLVNHGWGAEFCWAS